MTAATATGATRTLSSHRSDVHLPYSPRPLSRGQRGRREVFVYQSPRNHRVVTIADAACFAYALLLEFDPHVQAYVERPRELQVTTSTRIDVSFWSIAADGQQRFHLLVPHDRTSQGTRGTVILPANEELQEIALRNGVHILYVSEDEVMSKLQKVATAYELLPLVWDSERVIARAVIAEQISALLRHASSLSISAVVSDSHHPHRHVLATVAWMVHQGVIRLVEYVPGAVDGIVELAHE